MGEEREKGEERDRESERFLHLQIQCRRVFCEADIQREQI